MTVFDCDCVRVCVYVCVHVVVRMMRVVACMHVVCVCVCVCVC